MERDHERISSLGLWDGVEVAVELVRRFACGGGGGGVKYWLNKALRPKGAARERGGGGVSYWLNQGIGSGLRTEGRGFRRRLNWPSD